MPVLTRRRDPDAQQETWRIHYGDTHIGTIRLHAGVGGVDRWAWSCGFYPASRRGVRADGSARTFDDAHADFEEAWHRLLPEITKKDFVEHRRYRALEAWKRAMWKTGCKLSHPDSSGERGAYVPDARTYFKTLDEAKAACESHWARQPQPSGNE